MPSTFYAWCPDVKVWPSLMPRMPGGDEMIAGYAGDYICMLRGAEHPDEAYTFMEWMVMKGNLMWTKAGVDTNCIKRDAGVLRDDWPDIFGDKAAEISKWWAESLGKSGAVNNLPSYQFIQSELVRVFDLALHKQVTPEEALNEAQETGLADMEKYTLPE